MRAGAWVSRPLPVAPCALRVPWITDVHSSTGGLYGYVVTHLGGWRRAVGQFWHDFGRASRDGNLIARFGGDPREFCFSLDFGSLIADGLDPVFDRLDRFAEGGLGCNVAQMACMHAVKLRQDGIARMPS